MSLRNVQLTSTVKAKSKSSMTKNSSSPSPPGVNTKEAAWRKHLVGGGGLSGSGSSGCGSGGSSGESIGGGGNSGVGGVVVSANPAEERTILLNNNDIEMPEYIVDIATRTTYLKGKFLGKGGFARVHELTDLTTNRVYAGKIIAKSHITQPHHKEKIDREVELHRTLRHHHVVQFHHYFEDELNVYIVLENCPKKSLVHVMKQRSVLTEPEVRYFMRQLVDGVHYIHSQNVIHRDLKLGNMFLADDMIMKIGDFGLATRLDPNEGKKRATICGTPNYIAPEVLNKDGHGFQADIWAMGCIMYAMLVGQPPFETATLKDTYLRILTNSYMIPPLISTSARNLITELLQSKPWNRPTLERIREHDFFTSGYCPTSLPTSCCCSPPVFTIPDPLSKSRGSSPIYECPSSFPPPLVAPQQLSSFNQEVNNIANGMTQVRIRSHKSVECFKDSISRREKLPRNLSLKEVGKKEKDPSLHSAIRQRLTRVLCPEKSFLNKKLKVCSAVSLYNVLSTCLSTMPNDMDGCAPFLINSPIQFVVKWIDYSNKYGFGFQLSDRSVGVLFNDYTKIGLSPDKSRVEFIDLVGKLTVVSTSSIPVQLQERYTLLSYFSQYMDENLTEGGDTRNVEWGKRKSPIPYMKRWLRTSRAIIMQLSTGTLQVNFLKDHTKIITSFEKSEFLVTYINEERNATTYRLSDISSLGCSFQIRERLLYAINVLKEFASLEVEDP